MANFDDIAGWQEELRELKKTNAFLEGWKIGPMGLKTCSIPISNVYEFIELILGNGDLNDCITKINRWFNEQPDRISMGDDDPEQPTYPYDASAMLGEFEIWYCLKSNIGPYPDVFNAAISICEGVNLGIFSSPRDENSKNRLKKINTVVEKIDWEN